MKKQDTYGEPKVFTYPGIVAKVYSPILTEAEKQMRMSQISKAAERLLTKEIKNN